MNAYKLRSITLAFLATALLLTGCAEKAGSSGPPSVEEDGDSGDATEEDAAGTEGELACETNQDCLELLGDGGACKIALCNSLLGTCFFGERKDYTACDDGDLCTVGEVCLAGECSAELATSLDCDDGNPCTTESCDAEAGCTSLPNSESCDDGNPCTAEDQCRGTVRGNGERLPLRLG